MPNSWLHLQHQDPEFKLDDSLSMMDAFQARDCGWVEQMRPFIREFSAPEDLIVDPFVGFASTLIAAHLEGRRAVGIEIEENRFQIARQRIKNLGIEGVELRKGDCNELMKGIGPVDLILTNIPYFGCGFKPSEPQQLYSTAYYGDYLYRLRESLKQFRYALKPSGHVICMVQNVHINQQFVPQAWDAAKLMAEQFQFIEERVIIYDKPDTATDNQRSNRAHEYALIARNIPQNIDLELTVEIASDIQAQFPDAIVFGSVAAWLDGSGVPPSDLDIFMPFDPALIQRLFTWLTRQGFDITRWGKPCSSEGWRVICEDTNYLRAERLDAHGSRVLIDIGYSNDPTYYQHLLQHQTLIKGIRCSRYKVSFSG